MGTEEICGLGINFLKVRSFGAFSVFLIHWLKN